MIIVIRCCSQVIKQLKIYMILLIKAAMSTFEILTAAFIFLFSWERAAKELQPVPCVS